MRIVDLLIAMHPVDPELVWTMMCCAPVGAPSGMFKRIVLSPIEVQVETRTPLPFEFPMRTSTASSWKFAPSRVICELAPSAPTLPLFGLKLKIRSVL